MERYNIGLFKVSRTNLSHTLDDISNSIKSKNLGYICVSNGRVAYQSNHDPDYCAIQNNSLLTVPDGKPLVWIAHNKGLGDVGQVAGNELFHGLLNDSKKNGYSHFFYGSTQDTIDKMRKRVVNEYPDALVVGAVSPPFQPIEDYDIDGLADEINRLSPSFFWVGLGAPKQERLMALLQPKLKNTICIGVGLVFEYYAGTVKRAPKWARKMGLEALVNCLQQPVKRGKRMIKTGPWIIGEILKSKFDN